MSDNGLRLLTLGRLDLVRGTGEPADPSLSTRRRKLALLAVLAVHRRPIARDTLLEYFWGDQEDAKARHSLSDALSHLRRVLGRDAITTTATSAALAADAPLTVDALEFVAAIQRNDAETAVNLYDGAFLDGLGRGASVAFEQWLEGVRAQFDRRFALACEQRCTALADAGEWDHCVEIATRWQLHDPSSAGAFHFQLRALAAPGSREAALAALRSFERYRARLADEYGLRPDQALADFARVLADRVRETDAPSGMTMEFATLLRTGPQRAVQPAAFGDPAAAAAELTESLTAITTGDRLPAVRKEEASAAAAPPPPAATAPSRRRRLLRVALGAAVALALVITAGSAWRRSHATAAPPAKPLFVITDVRLVRGDSTELWLTDGLAQLITASLARSVTVDVVAPGRVRDATMRAEFDPNRLDVNSALVVARSLHADLLVRGGLVQGDTMLLLDLTVTDTKTGNTRDVLTAQGRDLVTLASSAATRLADLVGGDVPGPRVADLETPSVDAYEHYMRALRLFDGLSLSAGIAELDAAIAIDSGFVSAVAERQRIAIEMGETEITRRLGVVLDRFAWRASPWVRLTREAETARLAGDAPRTIRLLHELVDRHARDPRAYNLLASMYGNLGDFVKAESITVQQLALDSLATAVGRGPCASCSGYSGLRVFRMLRGDMAGSVAAAERLVALQPDLPGAWAGLFESYGLSERFEEADRAFERIRALQRPLEPGLRAAYARQQIIARRFERADSLLDAMERDPDLATRLVALDVRALYWRELGAWDRSNAALQRWADLGGDPTTVRLMRGNNYGRLGRYAEAERQYRQLLDETPDEPQGEMARRRSWVLANLADAIAPAGDTARLKLLADSIEFWSRRSYYARDARLPFHVRGLVAMQGGRLAEARDLFRQARWGGHGWTRTGAELARVLDRLGDRAGAEQVRRDALASNLDAMGRYEPRTTFLRELGMSDPASAAAITAGVGSAARR